jgi:hypothetical protein
LIGASVALNLLKISPGLPSQEWLAALFGMLGAGLLALNVPSVSRWGWLLFLGSNFVWIRFSWNKKHLGMLTQQVVFLGTSLLGVMRYF